MTSITHFRFLKQSNNFQNNLTNMKAVALMVFLLLFLTSVIAHAEHLVFQDTTLEQQDCQLCNHGIDTPPDLLKIKMLGVTRYYFVISKAIATKYTPGYFIIPPSRAPPRIS